MGTTATTIPSFCSTPSKADVQLRQLLDALVEAMEVRLGRRGDPKDRAITLRELIDSGLAKELLNNPFDPGTGVVLPGFESPPAKIETTIPSIPTGLSASGAFTKIILTWDSPQMSNLAYSEVYRSATNFLGDAVRHDTTQAFVWADTVDPGETYFYWVRHVSTSDIIGPFAGSVTATTAKVDASIIQDAVITGAKLVDGAVIAVKIAEDAVTTAKIAANAVVEAKIGAAAVTTAKIANDAVTTAVIAAGAITATEIGSAAVTTAKIANDAVTTAIIAAGAITATELGSAAVTTAKIAANAVVEAGIGAAAVTTAKIANDAVTTALINASAITTTEIADDAITSAKIIANAVTASEIAAGTITTTQIAANTIVAGDIASGTITATEIAANAVTASEIAANAVTASEIAAGTITATEIATDAITSAKILANAVTASEIAAGTITTTQIAANTIVAGDIASGTITATQIAANAITSAKIAANTIVAADIASGTITTTQIAANTIVAGDIAAGTITTTQIAASTIVSGDIAANTIVAGDIAGGTITGTQIAADTIAASNMAANSITAANAALADASILTAKIADAQITNAKISDLAADKITAGTINSDRINAASIASNLITAAKINMTDLFGQTITLASGGHIKQGQSDFNTGDGFFLGTHSSTVKFSIGKSGAGEHSLSWNGSTLDVLGNLSIEDLFGRNDTYTTGIYGQLSSAAVVASDSDLPQSYTGIATYEGNDPTTWTTAKSWKMNGTGIIAIGVKAEGTDGSGIDEYMAIRIMKNGTTTGTHEVGTTAVGSGADSSPNTQTYGGVSITRLWVNITVAKDDIFYVQMAGANVTTATVVNRIDEIKCHADFRFGHTWATHNED